MSTSVRTRRTSENPASRRPPGNSYASGSIYESRSRYRDEVTTNDAPEWQSKAPSRLARPRTLQDDDTKSGIAFRAPPVAPLDSVSMVQSRAPRNGRQYSTVSTRRPAFRQRSSSLDGTSWSGSGAPLTETNVKALNEGGGPATTTYSTKKSRHASRRQSNAVSDDEERAAAYTTRKSTRVSRRQGISVSDDEERTAAQQTPRSSRRRATVTGDEYEYGGGARTAKSKSAAPSARKSSTLDEEVIAAGAGGAAAAGRGGAKSRAVTKVDEEETSRVSRRTSQTQRGAQTEAKTTTQTMAVSTTQDRQVSTRTTAGRRSRASSSSSSSSESTSRPQRPAALSSPFAPQSGTSASSPNSPSGLEWERRVYIREYRRPSDGKWVSDRESSIRKLHSPQAPQIAAEV